MKIKDLVKNFESRYQMAESLDVSIHLLNNWISNDREVLKLDDGRWILINQKNKFISIEKKCDHLWIANSGKGGEPDFKINRQMSPYPLMNVKCEKCNGRTWLSQRAWLSAKQKL